MVRTKRTSRRIPISGEEPENSSRTPSPPAQQHVPVPPPVQQPAEPNPNEMGFVYRDNIQFERYNRLIRRACKCTRGVDWAFFEEVGLKHDFRIYLGELGLKKLSDMREDTYRNLTLEFLSSLEQVRRADTELPWGTLRFRLRSEERHLTPGEFGRIFEVAHEGSAEVDRSFSANKMWGELIGLSEEFVKEGNASQMLDPRDRMLHAFLACTLTFRGSSTHKVSKEDLFLIWCYKEKHLVNAAGWIMNRIYKTALKEKGDIMVGGYVTRIARYFGMALTDEDKEHRIQYVDQQHGLGAKILMGSRVIRKAEESERLGGRQYVVIGAGGTSTGEGQAQAQEEQGPAKPAKRRRTRAGSSKSSADQEASMTEMMATVMESMTSGFTELRAHMDAGFQSLDARIYRLEERFDAFAPPAPPSQPAPASHSPIPEFDPMDPELYSDQ